MEKILVPLVQMIYIAIKDRKERAATLKEARRKLGKKSFRFVQICFFATAHTRCSKKCRNEPKASLRNPIFVPQRPDSPTYPNTRHVFE